MNQPTNPTIASDGTDDLRALAWVQEELRRSLEAAHKALRRHQKEAAAIERTEIERCLHDPAGGVVEHVVVGGGPSQR